MSQEKERPDAGDDLAPVGADDAGLPPGDTSSDAPPEGSSDFFRTQAEADADWTRPLDVRRFVRGLLVGAAVMVFLGVGWFVMQRQKLALQQQLTKQLEDLGGAVHYDTDFDDQGQFLPEADRSKGFLANALGEDLFRRVEGVSLAADFDREALKLLAQFQELRMLSCRDTAVTDDDLAQLVDVVQLQRIDLAGTHVTAAGLVHLSSLPLLRQLTLDEEIGSRIDDAELDRILPNCEIRLR